MFPLPASIRYLSFTHHREMESEENRDRRDGLADAYIRNPSFDVADTRETKHEHTDVYTV